MRLVDVRATAAEAITANSGRPATATLHDSDDLRLVIFRFAAGQSVPPHRSVSTVMLTVLSGHGVVRGGDEERAVAAGDTVVLEPNELHAMRTDSSSFVLLATIAPRPGSRAAPQAMPNATSAAP